MFSLAKKVHVASTAIGGCSEPAKAPLSIARSLAPAAVAAPPSRHRGRGHGAQGACLEDAV